MTSAFQLNIDSKGVAHVVFDHPEEKVNVLSQQTIEELSTILDDLAENSNVKALVFSSAKKNVFIAGADVKEFKKAFQNTKNAEKMLARGHEIIRKIEQLPFPTIAVINGVCFGGGLELALGFKYRLVTDNPKTLLGLPEVNLGIFPGWGGTYRLPKLVGFIQGIKMVVTGKPVDGVKAWKIGLADAIAPPEFLYEKTDEFLEQVLAGKAKHRKRSKGVQYYLLEANPIGRALVASRTKSSILEKTKGHYPAPLLALKVIRNTYGQSKKDGLDYEKKIFVEALDNEFQNAKQLIRVFFNQERLKKEAGTKIDAAPKKIQTAGVIGAGIMGSGIAFAFSKKDIPIRMKDIHWDAIGKGYGAIWKVYQTLVKIRKLRPEEARIKFQRVSSAIDYSGFHRRDIVIEAATEELDLKLKILSELEKELSDETIIGTNTSSLAVSEMAKSMRHPERFLGLHFFNPVSRMPLVEVVPGESTSDKTVATAVELCRRLGKTPIVVGDCPGFLVNRIFAIGLNESLRMLSEGVSISQLDHAIADFGMPMGPCRLADEVGNDVNAKVMRHFEQAYGERMHAPEFLEKLSEKGLLGKKSGKGFYLYRGKKEKVNPEVQKMLPKKNADLSDSQIVERMILGMVNEAARCLQEGIAAEPMFVDMAMILGTGFPPFRGGLLSYADELGVAHVVERLQKLKQKYGDRFAPCELLVQMKDEDRNFYSSNEEQGTKFHKEKAYSRG